MKTIIKNEVISASAGTGKTFQLAVRYIKLVAAGVDPESIVALTFSKKAAGEILDRIIQLLCEWGEEPAKLAAIADSIDCPALSREELTAILRKIILAVHRLKVGTLHSFYVDILKAFPFEFGLNGDFSIVDDLLRDQIRQQVLKNILWGSGAGKNSQAFIEEFKKATFGKEEKSLLRHLDDFIQDYHECFMDVPDGEKWGKASLIWPEGLGLNPSSETSADINNLRSLFAADELSDAQMALWELFFLEAENHQPGMMFSKKAEGIFLKLCEERSNLQAGEASIAVSGTRHHFSTAECPLLVKLLDYLLNCQVEACLARTRGIFSILERYEESYESLMRRNGRLSFKDILFLLATGTDQTIVLTRKAQADNRLYIDYRMDSRFDHWLLDEFQDTNYYEWSVISNLIHEIMQDETGSKSFFYVGDIKQSIYQWRDGDPKLFNAIKNNFNALFDGALDERHLAKSFRSADQVISTINRVFQNLLDRGDNKWLVLIPENSIKRLQWQAHQTNCDHQGYAALIQVPREEKGRDHHFEEKKAKVIIDQLKAVEPFQRKLSVAILTRTNKAAAFYAGELERAGIRTALEGEFAITDNALVSTFLSLVRLAEHPGDSFAAEHLRMTPFRNYLDDIGELSMQVLAEIHTDGFAILIEKWSQRLREEQGIAFDAFHEMRLEEFFTAAEEFDETGNRNGLEFVDFIGNFRVPSSSSTNAVQVMTVHKSKGLEFDIVFLPSLNSSGIISGDADGIRIKKDMRCAAEWVTLMPRKKVAQTLPVLREFIDEINEDSCYEALCLLYVAMTRAATALYLLVDEPSKTQKTVYHADLLRGGLMGGVGESVSSRQSTTTGSVVDVDKQDACRTWENTRSPGGEILLCENGDAAWYEDTPIEKSAGPVIEEGSFSIDFEGILKKKTPSGNEGYVIHGDSLFAGGNSRAMELGTAVHEIFEGLGLLPDDWQEAGAKAFADWQRKNDFAKTVRDEAEKLFMDALASPEVRDALKLKAATEVWQERSFDIILDGSWISGTIDRVTLIRDEQGNLTQAVVLDYKTDQVTNDAKINAKIETYAPQLEMYRQVLSRMLNLPVDKISKQLLFVRPGKVVGLGSGLVQGLSP